MDLCRWLGRDKELVSENDEVIQGRDIAIQLLRSTIAQQDTRLCDQESLIACLSANVLCITVTLGLFIISSSSSCRLSICLLVSSRDVMDSESDGIRHLFFCKSKI